MLGEQDKIDLVEIIAGALERALAPSIDAITNLSARTGAVESRLTALAQVTESGFRNVVERLDSLDVRVEAIEERVGRVVGTVTRGRTTDIDRIAALEKRVAELEALLQKPAQS